MKILSEAQLDSLLLGAHTIEEDGLGLKVARLSNGDFLKLYRRKRLLSSALWSPPARRFARNAERLRELGIAAPMIEELMLIPGRKLNAVQYRPLPGDTLRNRWRTLDDSAREKDVEQFGAFLGQLHQLGVYFRSLHLGNVLKLPEGELGLIDLSDMKIENRPLAPWKRRRNLQHILRYKEDSNWLLQLHRAAWIRGYSTTCGKSAAARFDRDLSRIQP
ncbi:lipopolysaccharide kinase InaA family protein [Pseudomonas sp. JS3066]|uniref:lipopolysaccharide kinase InaA family protein n=1 Tax=Pseudomonas sp. JS3066 TaxID=3090665 RepID=UPI002E7BE2D5|nr:lipopolysaccharide kinase InaA family protein [Pseudomonas sp. JS3066]WVK92684.1 lipopolysaccharide kinase InaA family protein [Pseudomonas sp. JS3066]